MTSDQVPPTLSIVRASDIDACLDRQRWLVHTLWTDAGCGVLGGPPKCGKTWLALEIATAVTSGVPALGAFSVEKPGPVILALAEDSLPAVRQRLNTLAKHHLVDLDGLDLFLVDEPAFRLDDNNHLARLRGTIDRLAPRLLVLDPLVRFHRRDENSSAEIAGLLAELRAIQRATGVAVLLVHHVRKNGTASGGAALRGSGDLHAWGDSNLYLSRAEGHLRLVIEHRSEPTPLPLDLDLIAAPDGQAHLQLSSHTTDTETLEPLVRRTLNILESRTAPVSRTELRNTLHVNNQRLGDALKHLALQRLAQQTSTGWTTRSVPVP